MYLPEVNLFQILLSTSFLYGLFYSLLKYLDVVIIIYNFTSLYTIYCVLLGMTEATFPLTINHFLYTLPSQYEFFGLKRDDLAKATTLPVIFPLFAAFVA